jgi:hypothetical protein
MIAQEDFQFISKFDNANSEIINDILTDNAQQVSYILCQPKNQNMPF